MTQTPPLLVLASGSATRRALLEAAGVEVEVRPAPVEEAAIRDAMLAADRTVSHESIALALAEEKAKFVSADVPNALVIGADQVLSFEGRLFEKPKSVSEARAHLLALRGKSHALHSAVALAKSGTVLWQNTETAYLTFRDFSEEALDGYLARVGDTVLTSVGAYQIEGPAIQLFEEIEGDHTTILGLPILPLLRELRRREVLVS
ncbi:Maf family nucleotide pyrophosphatase [uncultured Hyphomicrobium sp.]|uniref:Maf family protein n=1 Tax=uncultured Hyphomicrobium sp. TaxID=194373 RepID=UPI0025E43339|nr:Maf family nucleotide pyrophosphatase [uncultured Hyphomicrobium sp.]